MGMILLGAIIVLMGGYLVYALVHLNVSDPKCVICKASFAQEEQHICYSLS